MLLLSAGTRQDAQLERRRIWADGGYKQMIGDGDVGIAADIELVRIGRASVGKNVDPSPVAAAAGLVGERSGRGRPQPSPLLLNY